MLYQWTNPGSSLRHNRRQYGPGSTIDMDPAMVAGIDPTIAIYLVPAGPPSPSGEPDATPDPEVKELPLAEMPEVQAQSPGRGPHESAKAKRRKARK